MKHGSLFSGIGGFDLAPSGWDGKMSFIANGWNFPEKF
jgi:site-specific DNA-cytosine methylase